MPALRGLKGTSLLDLVLENRGQPANGPHRKVSHRRVERARRTVFSFPLFNNTHTHPLHAHVYTSSCTHARYGCRDRRRRAAARREHTAHAAPSLAPAGAFHMLALGPPGPYRGILDHIEHEHAQFLLITHPAFAGTPLRATPSSAAVASTSSSQQHHHRQSQPGAQTHAPTA